MADQVNSRPIQNKCNDTIAFFPHRAVHQILIKLIFNSQLSNSKIEIKLRCNDAQDRENESDREENVDGEK